MESSVHALVTPERVSDQSGISEEIVAQVLVAQRQAINIARAANHVVVMPAVILHHRGDPLGSWCREHDAEIFSDENLERVAALLAADDSLVGGTALVRSAGCPTDYLRDRSGDREVWTLGDLQPLVVHLSSLPASEADALVDRVLTTFWELAAEAGARQTWVWPYDRVAMEKSIEDWLEANLDALRLFGMAVRLAEPAPGITGRQWRSIDGSSRLDLLLEVTEDGSTVVDDEVGDLEVRFCAGDLVVVELKAVPLDRDSVALVRRYMRAVEKEVAEERRVWGLLVGPGADASAWDALDADEDDDPIMTLWLSQIGFTRQFLGDFVDPPPPAS